MNSAVVTIDALTKRGYFVPVGAHRNTRSRLELYQAYLAGRGRAWWQPDLVGWRDALLAEGVSPVSVRAYLSTVRGRYNKILQDNDFNAGLNAFLREQYPDASPADLGAIKNEFLLQLQNSIAPINSQVDVIEEQDIDESRHVWLSGVQVDELLSLPDVATLAGLRDRALIALAICTGARAEELSAVTVAEVRARYGGQLALKIRRGKGNKQRLIPYGDLAWCLELVNTWLEHAGVTEGAVFRAVNRWGHVADSAINPQAFRQDILPRYVLAGGIVLDPHDLRRTYARLQFLAGMSLEALRQNMGHASQQTTLRYIGALDADLRGGRGWT